jgi:hypothetical protein
LASKLQALDDAAQLMSASRPTFHKESLRFVRVHHLSSLRDLLQYLLSIQASPSNQQPQSALIVDGIDVFCRASSLGDEQSGAQNMSPSDAMNLIQLSKFNYRLTSQSLFQKVSLQTETLSFKSNSGSFDGYSQHHGTFERKAFDRSCYHGFILYQHER